LPLQVLQLQVYISRFTSPGFYLQVCRSRFYSSRFYISRFRSPDLHLQVFISRFAAPGFTAPGLYLQIYISRFTSPGLHLQVLHPDFHLHALLVIVSTDLIPILYPFPFFRYLKCS